VKNYEKGAVGVEEGAGRQVLAEAGEIAVKGGAVAGK
jgi:hypothetical protein